jgi:hypothetical protein
VGAMMVSGARSFAIIIVRILSSCRRAVSLLVTDRLKALILQAMHFFIMAILQGWQIFLIILAGVLALLFIAYQCSMLCWATRAYAKMVQDNTISSMSIPLPPNA